MSNYKLTFLKDGKELSFNYKFSSIIEAADSIIYQSWGVTFDQCIKIEKID
jgi:hypothetical protein